MRAVVYRLSFRPVRNIHFDVFTPRESAYFFNCWAESLSGSLVCDRIRKSFSSLNLSYTFLILVLSLGQTPRQVVKKYSATYTFPSTSLSVTVFPSWLTNEKG